MGAALTVQRAKRIAAVLAASVLVLSVALYAVSPIEISVNGRTVKARRGEPVMDAARRVAPDLMVRGDLLDVNGEVLTENKGGSPRVLVGTREATTLDVVGWNREITVVPGVDEVEDMTSTLTWSHFGYQKVGDGSLPVVIANGQLAAVRTNVGAVSGATSAAETVGVQVEPIVHFAQLPVPAPKLVALTFDDGPNDGETSQILDILAAQGAKATFFVIGENVEKYPALVARAAAEGHQIGIHAYGHPNFKDSTPEEIAVEVTRCADAIQSAAGFRPEWVRPPYGGVDGLVYTQLTDTGYRVALWSVDPADYSRPGFQPIINRVVYNTVPGSVVLMHDGGGDRTDTIASLPGIIGELRDAGYQFVTIEQLAAASALP